MMGAQRALVSVQCALVLETRQYRPIYHVAICGHGQRTTQALHDEMSLFNLARLAVVNNGRSRHASLKKDL